jgi:hypothetical protein
VFGHMTRPAPAGPGSPRRAALAAAARFVAGTPFARSSFPRHCITMPQYPRFP